MLLPCAVVRNLTINDGEITGNNNVGSVAGLADGGARIEKITNTADVTGNANVGGIAGSLQSGSDTESRTNVTDLVNIGTIRGHEKVGGIIGYAEGIDLKGTVYNIGGITGIDTDGAFSHSVGGLIGEAEDSTIGDGENQIYNQLGVTGGYDVGGIVGYVHGDKTEIKNAANYGDVTATGFMTSNSNYQYHTLVTGADNLPHNAVVEEDDYGNSLATIESVYIANAGGIAGRSDGELDDALKLSCLEISDVQNYGNVTSVTETKNEGGNEYTYHTAGNVGGIVGSATNTNITNAENSENKISGAHNVGGIAGYLARESKISGSGNDGGEITATGARNESGFVQEWVSNQDGNEEKFNIGNAGGIVGYLFGPEAKITNSGNRGNVHTEQIKEGYVPPSAKAANVGGIAGKVGAADQIWLSGIKDDYDDYAETGTISNSYNTGEVRGYTGVGGIAGHMYKGAIVGSYNLGTVQTTRRAGGDRQDKDPLNMGGIVGDTSTLSGGEGTVLYDVYNAGQIGDETFEYYGRHVGGVAGRLSGDMEKAYNTGEIYNGYSVVGGVVGWWVGGNIKNVFNTGNITVLNNDRSNSFSEVGGIVGAYGGTGGASLTYAYNLGTLRSIKLAARSGVQGTATSLGGIIGRVRGKKLTISNVYTTNNLYAAQQRDNGSIVKDSISGTKLGAIYGDIDTDKGETPTISNSYFVKLYDDEDFNFNNLETQGTSVVEETFAKQQNTYEDFTFKNVSDANDSSWRIYEGSTLPILNAFTPYAASKQHEWNTDGWKVQYGTAANPLLTIINANGGGVTLDWNDLNISGAGSIAVYDNESLTINGFNVKLGSHYNGTLYSDGTLTINAAGGNDGALYDLGSGSRLYGSSVTFDAKGEDATFYGKITATDGGVTITGGKNITVLGELSTPTEDTKSVEVNGISKEDNAVTFETGQLNSIALENKLQTVEEANAHTTDATTNTDAGIVIDASGRAEILYGNMGDGRVTTAGVFSVSGKDSVYIDSDLHIGKDLNLSSDGEIVLDLSNMGSYDSVNEKGETISGKENLHKNFLDHFKKSGTINVGGEGADGFMIALDMWDDGAGKFNLNKYDVAANEYNEAYEHDLVDDLGELKIRVNNSTLNKDQTQAHTYIWIDSAEQLNGIQAYKNDKDEAGVNTKILTYNFALKDDIDASALTGYEEIGGTTGYSGTFDGRGFRIIGLNAAEGEANKSKASSGIFSTVSEGGVVKDLRVYASDFFGNGESAGAIAAVNEGTITGVTTFGNSVEAKNAGGIAGKNSGSIFESTASDSVTANGEDSYAGGITGVNSGTIGEEGDYGNAAEINANSAVRSGTDSAAAIGGVVGKNETDGEVWLANSLGVTTGANAESTGGIAGTNSGTMTSLYNESIVTGGSSVGGVAGDNSGTMTNAVNATGITATGENSGGIAGTNSGEIISGRNAGTINGTDYVGGMVGSNGEKGILKNLSNAIVAAITGTEYVGGIAGSNAGSITSDNNLTNEGTVSGHTYVGGIAGVNTQDGTIENVLSETLMLKTGNEEGAQYFGGIAGQNRGTITNATNNSNVRADGATFVGGIVGQNTETGTLVGELTNKGNVSGKDKVGGLAGENNNPELLQGTKDENGETIRLVVTNAGKVSASGGSAGGIFYNNTGNIIDTDLTNTNEVVGKGDNATGGLFGTNSGNITNSTLTNTGTVTGNGVTGGLIGENFGAVTGGSKLTNRGTVKGGDNTGGLIGKNSGDVSFSSLINEYGAEVTGGNNTGGLIGKNTGEIKGGRGEGNDGMTMYTDKIYNNGTVSGASNVGGLIGNNAKEHDKTGSLYAAYNTGTVFGTGNNVGGIVGTNAGTVSSIFNTIMTATGENQSVTGASNVGGLIGSNTNTGTLSFAYNTTTVNGSNAGGLVGNNAGKLSDAYSTSGGNLVGAGTEKGDRIYNANDSNKNNKDTYKGFTFTDDSEWTIYDGYSAPLLKVFLTEAKYAANENFTYNGQEQQAGVEHVTAADGKKAYQNANELLTALGYTDADSYMAFYSDQIAASDENGVFNPNNLGYYIKSNIMDIAQKELTISDIIASIMYGGDKFTSVDGGSLKGVIGTDDVYIEGWNMNDLSIDNIYRYLDENGRYAQNRGVRNTADVLRGEDGSPSAYANSFAYAYSNLSLAGGKAKNYKLADGGAVGGKITVTPAKLTVNADDASAVYGSDSWNYGYKLDGLANEDTAAGLSEELSGIKYDNTAAFDGTDGRYTADARRYEGAISVNLTGVDLKNYEVVAGNKGTAAVTPAKLTITADDQSVLLGTRPEYTGTAPADLGNQLVNGDSLHGFSYIFGVADTGLETEIGRHEGVIGLFAGGHFYGGGTHDLSTLSSVFHNYDVTVDAGTLTVSAGDNFGHLHWLHRGGERVRNFRERKAGLHFVDGGMIYEEDM